MDSNFAGNSDPDAKRRSQIGIIAMQNGFPVFWSSKISSVAFADKDIGEAHADTSSGAAEVYAAGHCTYDFLFLSHVAGEMRIDFPRPFKIQMDNSWYCFQIQTQTHRLSTGVGWDVTRQKDMHTCTCGHQVKPSRLLHQDSALD